MADNSEITNLTMKTGDDSVTTAGNQGAGDAGNGQPIPPGKPSLLVVLGEPFSVEQQQLILQRLSNELQTWDKQASGHDIGEELQSLVSKQPAVLDGTNGEKIVEQMFEAVSVTIVINPTLKTLVQRIRSFLLAPGSYRHLLYSGKAIQKSGCWILQDALFTYATFADLLQGADVAQALKSGAVSGIFNLSIFTEGEWGNVGKLIPQLKVSMNVASQGGDQSAGFNQFITYVQSLLTITSTQDLLPSTNVVGNIRFNRPTLYVFPGSNGDSALFGISGFNLLVNGGYSRKSCFWEFARHLDRIDALLVTHIGPDNLFGLGTALARKAADASLHPNIGYVYMNACPSKTAGHDGATSETGGLADKPVQKEGLLLNLSVEASSIADDVRHLGLIPHPLTAPAHGSIAPTNLYHKIGHGSLDVYTLNPVHDSKVLKDFISQWSKHTNGFTAKAGSVPLSNATSICAVLVWKPAASNDAVTRVLFTGAAPQAAVFEGLDRLKGIALFQHATCSEKTLNAPSKAAAARKSITKSTPPVPAASSKPASASVQPKQDAQNVSKQAGAGAASSKPTARVEPKKTAPAKEPSHKPATSPTKPQKITRPPQDSTKKAVASASVKSESTEQASKTTVVPAESVQLVDLNVEPVVDNGSNADHAHSGVDSVSDAVSSSEPHTDDLQSPISEPEHDVVHQQHQEQISDKVIDEIGEGVDVDRDIDTSVDFMQHEAGEQAASVDLLQHQDEGQAAAYEGVVPDGLPEPQISPETFSDDVKEDALMEHHDTSAAEGDNMISEDQSFDPQTQWGQPMGLPAPNKLPGSGKDGANEGAAASGGADTKKGGAAAAQSKPPAKPTNGKEQAAAKLNESVNKPPSTLGRKNAPAATGSRPQSSADHHASFSSKDAKQQDAKAPVAARPAAAATAKKAAPAPAKPATSLKPVVPFYVDLAYVPGHGGSDHVDGDFFRRVRARYYVLSTVNPDPHLLTSLLDAKATWDNGDAGLEVTLIPTYDADVLRYWMGAHRDAMSRLKIDVAPAANRCSIQLQDQEASCAAYRLEF